MRSNHHHHQIIWLQERNIPLFINSFRPDVSVLELIRQDTEDKAVFKLAGRIMLKRHFGKVCFIDLKQDAVHIQILLKINFLSEEHWEILTKGIGLGDIIGVTGSLGRSNSGDRVVIATQIHLLSKSISQWPEKYHGTKDKDSLYRKRYLALNQDSQVAETFIKRSKIIFWIRSFMIEQGFLEVETPMLQEVYSGAEAEPFITHHKSLARKLYLRVAPELYLKRLQVGGLNKVFEINRNFRNEGLSSRHQPEFTMMEFYEAYKDYRDAMAFTENLIHSLGKSLHLPANHILLKQFRKVSMEQITREHLAISADEWGDKDYISARCSSSGVDPTSTHLGILQFSLFDHLVAPHIQDPTFVYDYPSISSPLAWCMGDKAERAELFAAGIELCNLYSEMTDPYKQKEAFENQENTMMQDLEFLEALNYGMPPCAGVGIGIDRLVMLLTDNKTIRDVILFPTLREKLQG